MRGAEVHLNWLQTGSAGLFLFLSGFGTAELVSPPRFDFDKPHLRQLKHYRGGGKARMTDRVIFCYCWIDALASAVSDEDSRKHLAPDTSFITAKERNVKWQGHLRKREEETSAIWFGRRNATQPAAQDSLCMQSPASLWIIATCARCVSKEMIRTGGSPSEAASPTLSPERHACRNGARRERNQYTWTKIIF